MPNQDINVTVKKQGGCTSGCLAILALGLVIGLPLEAWQASSLGLRILEVIGLVAVASGAGYLIYRHQTVNASGRTSGSTVQPAKFRIANYDGGLSPHPSPEAKGDLTLNPDGKWYLVFANSRGSIYAPARRYALQVTPTGPSSCHATVRDRQDPSVRATFDLPKTSATVFQQAMRAYLQTIAPPAPQSARPTLVVPEGHPSVASTPPSTPLIAPAQPVQAPAIPGNAFEQIKQLAALREAGMLTEAEFQAKKTELLGRI